MNNHNSQFTIHNSQFPRHVAIVMDGNGRWAEQRGKYRWIGHRAGAKALEKIVAEAGRTGVEVLSVFAFSTENWQRPKKEVTYLMNLLLDWLPSKVKILAKNNIRLRVIGRLSDFSLAHQQAIIKAEQQLANNTGLMLVIAISYSGQWDIAQATKQIAQKVLSGDLALDQIDVDVVAQHVTLHDLPSIDLFIRTGGEQRISNFFLWQLAYTELYFTEQLWPDFNEQSFALALQSYAGRQRRFGKVKSEE